MEIVGSRYNPGKYNTRQVKPRPSRARIVSLLLLTIFCLTLACYGFMASRWNPSLGYFSYDAKSIIHEGGDDYLPNWPVAGLAAVGDLQSGVYKVKDDIDVIAPIASMAKVITALVILDKAPLDIGKTGFEYAVTEADVLLYHQYVARQGSVMPISTGQKVSQYDLLQGLLLLSGNNAADYLAQAVFGSVNQYSEYANEFVKSKGLYSTSIDDASGFSELTTSKPSDMITVGQLALRNPVIAEIVNKRQVDIANVGQVANTNKLLTEDKFIGIKTGNTDQAGKCLLFAVNNGPGSDNALIFVIMGQPNWDVTYAAARSMAQFAAGNFTEIELVPAYSTVATVSSRWGQSGAAVVTESLDFYGWMSKDYNARVNIQLSDDPKKGDVIGYVDDGLGSDKVPVTLDRNIPGPSLWWRIRNYWYEIK